ncbi:2-oxoacid:acceptor oxidoreductase subunit alpha [Patescibacteria group bacterium]|nr:2-oxoacid:acceptor oxidoreductase subunit alpha [Patescibacteria group bacterium]
MPTNRYCIKLGGESGQGINTLGILLSRAIKSIGYNIFSYREYPSLIKGGVASYQIDFSNQYIASSSKNCNILTILDPEAVHEYLHSLNPRGILLYDDSKVEFTPEEQAWITQNQIHVIYLDSEKMAVEAGGSPIMANIVMTSFLWKLLEFNPDDLANIVKEIFASKGEEIINKNILCLNAGYNTAEFKDEYSQRAYIPTLPTEKKENKILTGNDAIALGAISAGVRAYYGYPMTPATSIFKYLGNTYKETGILIKQAESEITAVQMAMGSMAMGTRALTATSGGGFDLMQETISCAGITETPLVIVLAQRIGAGTGVPTWTGSSDIHTAVKSGHGEFPKAVLCVSDIQSGYILIQQAFNIAETYQIPVILLTEKQIAESLFTVETLPQPLQIQRGMYDGENRYSRTDNGISPRWVPDFNKKPYLNTSDEHNEISQSTENGEEIKAMSDKRMKKMDTLLSNLPEPTIYGNPEAQTVLVGCGSTKNAILDAIATGMNISYLHYDYLYPTKTQTLLNLVSSGKRIILVENNQTGELGKILTEASGYQFEEKILKYDGRPFFVEDILNIQI